MFMYEVIFLLGLGLIWVIFASIRDIRTTEVPNWISFSLVFFAFGFRFFYGIFSDSYGLFVQGLIGFGIFLIVGNVFYYIKLFAGGDAKLMMALGAVLPLFDSFAANLKVYGVFLFLFFFAGAVYGLILTLIISLRNFKIFKKSFVSKLKKSKKIMFFAVGFGLLLLILSFFENLLFSFAILLMIFPFFFFYAKAVDDVCMVRNIKTSDLREGDWINKDIKLGRKTIRASWAGLSKKDILVIRKKYKHIKIKQGIPFVPVFLIAYVVLIYFWHSGLWNAFW